MKKSKKSSQKGLDREEKKLLASFEKGEWETVKNFEKEKVRARKTAAKTLRKDVRINIRLTSGDLSSLKQIAAYEGLPYQTPINEIS